MAEAARKIGEVDSQGLRDICSGRKKAPAELIPKLMGLGADILYILTGQRQTQPVGGTAEDRGEYKAGISRREAALLDNYRHCGEEDRAAIDRVALNAATQREGNTVKKKAG